MKRCVKCEVEKPCDQFYKHRTNRDGLQAYCKGCVAIHARKYRRKSVAKITTEVRRARKAAYKAAHFDRYSAWRAVETAIKTGKLKRQPCEICGSEISEAHHPDYTQKLLVQWLCDVHHRMVHSKAGLQREVRGEA